MRQGAVLLLLVLLAGACGRDRPSGSGARRLVWQPAADVEAPQPERLAVYTTRGREAPWRAQAEVVLFEEPDGPQILRGPAPRRAILDRPDWVGRATHVEVTGTFRQPQRLQLFLHPAQGEALAGPMLDVPASPEERSLVFDLSSLEVPDTSVERLSLVATGRGMETQLQSLTLLRISPARLLPVVGRGQRWVQHGHEVRPMAGLLPGTRPTVVLEVPRGVRLEVDLARAPGDAGQGEARVVRVLATDGGRSVEQVVRLDRGTAFATAVLDLEPLAGRRVRATAVLETPEAEAVAIGSPRLVSTAERPPTVLLVTSDTHRADHLGVLDEGLRTPVLDALAARGVLYSDCSATANNTNPSHAALFTGRSPRDTGVTQNGMRLSADAPTLAEAFARAGYRTWAAVSVDHLTPASSGLGQGFERVFVPGEAPTPAAVSVERLARALEEDPAGPLFLWLHVFDAHAPYDAEERFLEPRWRRLPTGSGRVEGWPPWTEGLDDPEHLRALYRAEVSSLDEALGRLLSHPRLVAPEAVIAFTSDHGEVLEGTTRPLFDHVGLGPATLRVPLVLVHPGAPAGTVVERPVRHQDLGRTLLDLVGLESVPFPGRDLRAAPAGARFALEAGARSASVQEGRWMLDLLLLPENGRPLHALRLFDLERDPWAESDVSSEHPREARRLRERLVRWLVEAPEETWSTRAPALARARLEELGYSEGDDPPGRLMDPRCTCESCERWR